jgi:hypothetical protein
MECVTYAELQEPIPHAMGIQNLNSPAAENPGMLVVIV